jgi:geranylgeranyl pyrophosphate synthase
MIKEDLFDYSVFYDNLSKIGIKPHERFIEILYDNLENVDLVNIFNHLESYWLDNFRASVIWWCNEIIGGEPENTINLSVIMSLVGSGLGIHDDIIDRTRFKGSRETVQGLFGPERALVAGDLLITKGLTLLFLLDEFDKEISTSLNNVFQDYFSEMAIAEIIEINANKQINLDLDSHLKMLWKLGADMKACAKLGAISANASKDQVESLSYVGASISYINRLNEEINDIRNIKGNLRMRIKYESIPLALLYASKESILYYRNIKQILSKEELNEKDIKQMLSICKEIKAIKYIKEEINKTYYKAIKRLEIFPESNAKKMLTWCLYYIVNQNDVLRKKFMEITNQRQEV